MLAMLDKLLAPVAWLIAGVLAVMLLIGPQVIAEDKPDASAGAAPYATGGSVDGKSVFTESCGSCHTLAAAGTNGQVGPVLDGLDRSADDIEDIVRAGRGAMPPFEGDLSDDEVAAVAEFVAASR